MIKFDKPKNLNGAELRKELLNAGVKIGDNGTEVVIDEYGDFWLDISKANVSKAEPIVAAHNGTVIASEPTVIQKLASVGLSIDDLKDALGL